MIGPALKTAIARGIVRHEPAPRLDVTDLNNFTLVEAMIKWLEDNTNELARFDSTLMAAVLAEIYPEAVQADVERAVTSFELRKYILLEEIEPYWDTRIPDLSPIQAYGKAIGLGFMLALLLVLSVATVWAIL